jgi:uncharacterized membrane protein
MRKLAEFLTDNLSYVLFAMAAGWAVGFAVWEIGHPDVLESFLLTNQLPLGMRASLLGQVIAGTFLALLLWLGLGLLALVGRRAAPRLVMQKGATLALAITLLAFLPILILEDLATERPFLVFFLVTAMALVAFVTVNRASRLFDPAPDWLGRLVTARTGFVVVCCLALGYVLFMSLLTVARHNSLMTHSFDLGIHDQIVYNALHTGVLRSTQHGPQPINYLGNHFAPILFLVTPLYILNPDARTLLVLQSLCLGLGAIPIYLLAQVKLRSTVLAIAFSASYLLFPALHGINTFDFHQIALVTSLLLWALYCLETGHTKLFLFFLILAAATKEEVALTVAAFGIYLFLVKRRYALGTALTIAGVAYFALVVGYVMPALGGVPQVYRFGGLMAGGSSGLAAVVTTLITNPTYVLLYIFGDPRKIEFLFLLLLPVLFLPLLAGRSLILAVPAFSVALLASTEENFTIGTQYPAIMIPFVSFLAIVGIQRLDPRRFGRLALAAAILTASLVMNYEYGWLLGRLFSGFPQPTPHDAVVNSFFLEVPRQASVSAVSDLVPHLSDRETIYMFPTTEQADYILFDAYPKADFWPYISRNARSDASRALAPYLTSGEYGVTRADDWVLLLKRGADIQENPAALRVLFSSKYEAENLSSGLTTPPVQDNQASGGLARMAEGSPPLAEDRVAAMFGPYAALLPGKYRVSYRLKLAAPSSRSGPIATVDVFSTAMGGALAGQDIMVQDFAAPGQWQAFNLEVEIPRAMDDLEYRVLYTGPEKLLVDSVEIIPMQATIPVASYEAEELPGNSDVVTDSVASNSGARSGSSSPHVSGGSEALVFGPFARLIPGKYRAIYALRLPEEGLSGPAASIDVFSKTAGGPLAVREIDASAFKDPTNYERFTLDFETRQPWTDLEFRVFPSGDGSVLVDNIQVSYLLQ